MTASPHPKKLLETLLAGASSPKKKRALQGIHDECERLYNAGLRVFDRGHIGKALAAAGIMSAKTLSNATCAEHRAIIDGWSALASSGLKPTQPDDLVDDWIERIDDPMLRLLVNKTLSEARALRAKCKQLELLLSKREIVYYESGAPATHVIEGGARFTAQERKALEEAIDAGHWSDLDMKIGPRGDVKTTKGRQVHTWGFTDAVRKALGL